MKRIFPTSVLVSLLALTMATSEPGYASPQPGLPRTAFPPHTHVHIHLHVSNAFIDCTWSFAACDPLSGRPDMSEPVTHSHTMGHLHRLRGWEEHGAVPFTMSFVVWMSTFSSAASSAGACSD